MFSVYNSFHQTVKYGLQRNHILQDLTGLEIEISMNSSETENRFAQKAGINIPSLKGFIIQMCS